MISGFDRDSLLFVLFLFPHLLARCQGLAQSTQSEKKERKAHEKKA